MKYVTCCSLLDRKLCLVPSRPAQALPLRFLLLGLLGLAVRLVFVLMDDQNEYFFALCFEVNEGTRLQGKHFN